MIKLRPEVRRFAERMERALRDNDHKGDSWREMYNEDIMERIDEEIKDRHSDLIRGLIPPRTKAPRKPDDDK